MFIQLFLFLIGLFVSCQSVFLFLVSESVFLFLISLFLFVSIY